MKNITVSQKLLIDIKKEIEAMAITIDHEFGQCRTISKLVKDGDMPEVYYKLYQILKHSRYGK